MTGRVRAARPWASRRAGRVGGGPLATVHRRCYRGHVFGVGPSELALIAIVALMLFSPRDLPKILRSVAKFWGSLRATADEFREAIMTADGVDEIQELVKGGREELRRAENAARREMMKARAEMRKAQQKLAKTVRAGEELRKQELGEAPGEDATARDSTPEPAAPPHTEPAAPSYTGPAASRGPAVPPPPATGTASSASASPPAAGPSPSPTEGLGQGAA